MWAANSQNKNAPYKHSFKTKRIKILFIAEVTNNSKELLDHENG